MAVIRFVSTRVVHTFLIAVIVYYLVSFCYLASIANKEVKSIRRREKYYDTDASLEATPLQARNVEPGYVQLSATPLSPITPTANKIQSKRHKRLTFKRNFGYVMGTSFYDQLTGSFANLVSLQCWADSVSTDMRVVEPALLESVLNINLNGLIYDNDTSANFEDFFNRTQWNKMSEERKIAPLVSWEKFINDAPHKLILVDKPNERLSKTFLENAALLEKKYNFKIVRKTNFPNENMTPVEFKKLVYGHYNPHEAAVIFRAWGGIALGDSYNRVAVAGTKCGRRVTSYAPFSHNILQDSIKYTEKYIKNAGEKGYISVMIRMEHYLSRHNFFRGKTDNETENEIKKCLNKLAEEVNALKEQHVIESIFLTMDCRNSGSYMFKIAFPDHVTKIATDATVKLFPMLYGDSTTLEEWDKSFEETASFPEVSGYIAFLQKHLAAKGTCLLTVGGGSFQSTTHRLHSVYHPNGPSCSHHVAYC